MNDKDLHLVSPCDYVLAARKQPRDRISFRHILIYWGRFVSLALTGVRERPDANAGSSVGWRMITSSHPNHLITGFSGEDLAKTINLVYSCLLAVIVLTSLSETHQCLHETQPTDGSACIRD